MKKTCKINFIWFEHTFFLSLFLSGKIIMNTLTKLNFFEKNIAKIDKLLVKRSGNS